MHLDIFAEAESDVRYYCRRLPNLLSSARGAIVRDVEGRSFIDFMSACGALNYGHNHPLLKRAVLEHLEADRIIAGLDFHTSSKLAFIQRFREQILRPRKLEYKLQFPGPTGANCVEAAIKLARKVTGRSAIVAFTNAFHGMSIGALALTGSRSARQVSAPLLNGVIRIPFEGYHGAGLSELDRLKAIANDPSGGIDPIAAIIVETVQGEGGLNVASAEWLEALHRTARGIGALLIVDDIQAGCGRTGTFFSFERAGLVPDVVCLAKSISGLGLPMSLLLMKPEYDVWKAGEHNGTFRGNSLAFAAAAAAVDLWRDGEMTALARNASTVSDWISLIASEFGAELRPKGIGMMQGLEFSNPDDAQAVAEEALHGGVIIECCGPHDEVLKLMPPLNIDPKVLAEGLGRISKAIRAILGSKLPNSERYETHLDSNYDRGDAIGGAKFAHAIA